MSARIQLMALGGGSMIGASCYLIKIHDTVVLIDCGINPRQSPTITFDSLVSYANSSTLISSWLDLTAVILTHAHTDHCGLLPALHRLMYEECQTSGRSMPLFYASNATKELLPFTYRNILSFSADIPFSSGDVDVLLHRLRAPDEDGELDWLNPALGKIKFFPNSHLLGAVMVEITVGETVFLHTGDLKLVETPTLPATNLLPNKRPALLVIDGTYAGSKERRISKWDDVRREIQVILDRYLYQRGIVLFPCFALGRAQDVLTLVLEHADTHPELNHYIYLDGQARTVTRDIYPSFSHLLTKEYSRLFAAHSWRLRWVDSEETVDEIMEREVKGFPSIVIASSGMLLPGSASHRWATALVQNAKATIVTTGYLTEDTREELFDHRIFSDQRLAQSPHQLGISGHASLAEMQEFIKIISPEAVAVVHCGTGRTTTAGALLDWLNAQEIPGQVAVEGKLLSY